MSNEEFTNGLRDRTEVAGPYPKPTRAKLSQYRQFFAEPIAGLARCTDQRPDITDVVVLGYN